MGKWGSKLSKSSVKQNDNEEYDYAISVEQFNEISEIAGDYVEQGELEEAFHRYRACAFIMVKVHQNCAESYKAEISLWFCQFFLNIQHLILITDTSRKES